MTAVDLRVVDPALFLWVDPGGGVPLSLSEAAGLEVLSRAVLDGLSSPSSSCTAAV